jgi:hypothetical protein
MAKKPTYAKARVAAWRYFGTQGWSLSSPGLRNLHATHPNGQFRLWFKAQAVLFEEGGSPWRIGSAHTVSYGLDLRQWQPAQFYAAILKMFDLSRANTRRRRRRRRRNSYRRDFARTYRRRRRNSRGTRSQLQRRIIETLHEVGKRGIAHGSLYKILKAEGYSPNDIHRAIMQLESSVLSLARKGKIRHSHWER